MALAYRNNLLPWAMGIREARIFCSQHPPHPQLLLYKRNFYNHQPSVQSSPTPHLTVHSCLAPSGPWFRAGLGLWPADLGVSLSPELALGPARPVPSFSSFSAPSPLECFVGAAVRAGWAISPSPAVLALQWAVPGHHFPLLLQSLGVKCRHLESIRRSRLSIARSWPSTMSSDSVRMYWPL